MIVKHPTLVGVSRDVPNPADWVEQGWVLDAPPEPPREPKPRREPASDE